MSLAHHLGNDGTQAEGIALAHAAYEEAGPDAHPAARALSPDRSAWAHAQTGRGGATRDAGPGRGARAGGRHRLCAAIVDRRTPGGSIVENPHRCVPPRPCAGYRPACARQRARAR
jgi:hypothetical protein